MLQAGAGPLWVCKGACDVLALRTVGVPRVVAIFGVQGWRWDWMREVRELVPALDADTAGSSRGATRPPGRAAGKQVAVLETAAYGGCKDVSEAWAAGVLCLNGGPDVDGTLGHQVPQELWETWTERVAIMVVDGGLSPAEAECVAWAGFQTPETAWQLGSI